MHSIVIFSLILKWCQVGSGTWVRGYLNHEGCGLQPTKKWRDFATVVCKQWSWLHLLANSQHWGILLQWSWFHFHSKSYLFICVHTHWACNSSYTITVYAMNFSMQVYHPYCFFLLAWYQLTFQTVICTSQIAILCGPVLTILVVIWCHRQLRNTSILFIIHQLNDIVAGRSFRRWWLLLFS